MTEGDEALSALLESLADTCILAGWTADEVLNAVRRALSDSGERLGISRQGLARRLDISRRILSSWATKPLMNQHRRQLDVLLHVYKREDEPLEAHEIDAFTRATQDAVRFGFITRSRQVSEATTNALTNVCARLQATADNLNGPEKTRAQLSLGSRDANKMQVGPALEPQPGRTQAKRNEVDLQEKQDAPSQRLGNSVS